MPTTQSSHFAVLTAKTADAGFRRFASTTRAEHGRTPILVRRKPITSDFIGPKNTNVWWTDLREYSEDGAQQGIHVPKLSLQELWVFDFFNGSEITRDYLLLTLDFTLVALCFVIPL